eukprot:3004445-Prymnesium_polylepis.1
MKAPGIYKVTPTGVSQTYRAECERMTQIEAPSRVVWARKRHPRVGDVGVVGIRGTRAVVR